jgi:type I restriction enzyme, S subunit
MKWKIARLGEIARVERGKFSVRPRNDPAYYGGTMPFVQTGDISGAQNGVIRTHSQTLNEKGVGASKVFPKGTLLVSIAANIGDSAILGFESACPDSVIAVTPSSVLSTGFLRYYMSAQQRWLTYLAPSGAQKNINIDFIEDLEIEHPPLPEQQKIADILGTWDEALEKLDALIAAKARRKQALMQQLLTGHRRLPGFSKPWKRVELSDVAEECSIRNGQKLERTRLYAVTKAEGMVPMRENVQGATVNRCQIVERGWFAYNPMRINIGSIARWEGNDPVMVSPDYVVFRTKESLLLSDYLNHIRRGDAWTDFVGAAGNGSVRVRIWFDDLGYFEFPLPPIEEQRAIAAVLNAADTELQLLRQERAVLNQQKRGLMQKLLTGKVRVAKES